MSVRKVPWKDLTPQVRSFFTQVTNGAGVLVEGRNGAPQFGVVVLRQASPKQQRAARSRLARLQRKTGAMMKRTGKNEAELDRILQDEDDE